MDDNNHQSSSAEDDPTDSFTRTALHLRAGALGPTVTNSSSPNGAQQRDVSETVLRSMIAGESLTVGTAAAAATTIATNPPLSSLQSMAHRGMIPIRGAPGDFFSPSSSHRPMYNHHNNNMPTTTIAGLRSHHHHHHHQDDMALASTINASYNPNLHQLDSTIQMLQGQFPQTSSGLRSSIPPQQQSTLGHLNLGQIGPSNLFTRIQNHMQLDQQRLEQQRLEQHQQQQQQQLQLQRQLHSNQALMGNYFPTGLLSSGHSNFATMPPAAESHIHRPMLLQDSLLSNPANLVASQANIQQNLQLVSAAAAAANQGLDTLHQRSRKGAEHAASGRESTFPMKLHRILADPSFQDCICWLPHGLSWRVINQHVFTNAVLPEYFKHQKYASFMRQVNGKQL